MSLARRAITGLFCEIIINSLGFSRSKGEQGLADEKKISVSEVKKTIAASLAAAFGFVIALLWNEVVKAGIALAGIDLVAGEVDVAGWLVYVVTAVVITVVMIVLIIVIGRWGSK